MNREREITVKGWEGDEFVVYWRGTPIGQTLHEQDAYVVKRWLGTALDAIVTVAVSRERQKATLDEALPDMLDDPETYFNERAEKMP